jgi:peptide/nickel transport system substrate-binding protein
MQQSGIHRRWHVQIGVLLAMLSLVAMPYGHRHAAAQQHGGVLRIGMTAADIPYTAGRWRKGFQEAENATLGAMNVSYGFIDPFSTFTRFFHSGSQPPKSQNIMPYVNAQVDRLIEAAELEFDLPKQNAILAQVHEIIVEDAPWIFIVHDLNPRALSPKVKGYVQAQSWFQDLTPVWVEK